MSESTDANGATHIHFQATPVLIAIMRPTDANIGFLVTCLECEQTIPRDGGVKLYDTNVRPYKQTCHDCGKLLIEGLTAKWSELYTKPEEPPPERQWFKWTVEIEIHKHWVEDGFDLTDERLHNVLAHALPYANGNELRGKVLCKPDDVDVAKAMGYKSVEAYVKARSK